MGNGTESVKVMELLTQLSLKFKFGVFYNPFGFAQNLSETNIGRTYVRPF